MTSPKVSIIILNYNGKNLLEKFLPKILTLDYPNYETIVVDNGSKDGSVQFIKQNAARVILIENHKNLGFCRGNNIGAEKACGKYLWFLNSDVETKKDALTHLVNFAKQNPEVGICVPKIMFYFQKNKIQSAGMKFDLQGKIGFRGANRDVNNFNNPSAISFASGSALFIRKDLFIRLNKFDEKMFFNVEDLDLCLRSWILGYKVMCVPKSIVYHR